MSEHLASMNEQITSQNDKIDKLQQQLHNHSKVMIAISFFYCLNSFVLGWKKSEKMKSIVYWKETRKIMIKVNSTSRFSYIC